MFAKIINSFILYNGIELKICKFGTIEQLYQKVRKL